MLPHCTSHHPYFLWTSLRCCVSAWPRRVPRPEYAPPLGLRSALPERPTAPQHLHGHLPLNGYTLSGEGSGGAAGSGKGSANVRLEPVPGGTRLTWNADAQVSGKLAQIGSRLIDSSVNMMAAQFFDRFEQLLAGDTPGDVPIAASAFLPSWFRIAGWGALLLLVVVLYLLLF
ncbi:MAG: hypothetical protein HC869_01525 [Rhodospirillales bacterium]|nr:hypothetical protein [Rhodospirillales bacterium]